MNLSRLLSYEIVDDKGITQSRKVKKLFRCDDICKFCTKKGHSLPFCPSVPTVPGENERNSFVDTLLSTPRLKLKMYEGLSRLEVLQKVDTLGISLNKGNPYLDDNQPFSSLRKSLGYWKAIGADKSVLSWLAYGYQMKFARHPQRLLFKNSPTTYEYEEFIDQEVETHVRDGSFAEISEKEAWVVNPFIISTNSSGKPRRCDDMRYVNAHLASSFFKMQTLDRDLPNIIRVGDHMITRDLEKAYYKIPISEDSCKFQCFYWKNKYYKAKVLLFGFCQAPFVFTKIVRVVVRFFGSLLIRVMNFVDDFLFTDQKEKIEELALFVDVILKLIGWVLSMKDNQLGTKVKFLGFLIDSVQRRFQITPSTCQKTIKMIELVIEKKQRQQKIVVSDLQSLTGKLMSLKLAIPSMSVWLREVLRGEVWSGC